MWWRAARVDFICIKVQCQSNIILHKAARAFGYTMYILAFGFLCAIVWFMISHTNIRTDAHSHTPTHPNTQRSSFIVRIQQNKDQTTQLDGNATLCSSCNLSNTAVCCQISVVPFLMVFRCVFFFAYGQLKATKRNQNVFIPRKKKKPESAKLSGKRGPTQRV